MITDVAELYDVLGERLRHIGAKQVHAPAPVIEDACQFAWCRLICHASRLDPEKVLGLKLARRDQRELSLEARADEYGVLRIASPLPGPYEVAKWRERFAQVGELPVLQQRFLWLRAVGYTYDEIAARQPGLTERIVERQIKRGRSRLKAAA